MLTPDPAAVIRTLNPFGVKCLERAAGVCVARGHYEVTVEHLLAQLLVDPNADIYLILRHYGIEKGRLDAALQRHLEAQRGGNSGRPVFSPLMLNWIQDTWMLASTELRLKAVRSGALLTTLVMAPHSYTAGAWVDDLSAIPRDELRKQLLKIAAGSMEGDDPAQPGIQGAAPGATPSGSHSRTPDTALGRFTNDFTAQARAGELDPVIGRELEIRQCIDILARRRKNNPIIVGEAGVGKTALVEGIAQRVVAKEVPSQLANVDILGLDLGLLQAGAGVKGEFENRLKGVIEEVKSSPKPIILFIDEAHTIIGAGGPAGGSDAANLLKPSLARGELRTLAATTWSEYKKYFEKDPALTRRFQLVKVDEPSEANGIAMMRGLAPFYEKGHGIRIRDDAVVAAVELSNRYISGRQLPDKSVDLIDTCAARVSIAQEAKPGVLLDLERSIQILDVEHKALEREKLEGYEINTKQWDTLAAKLATLHAEREALEARWNTEREVVKRVVELRKKLNEAKAAIEATKEAASPAEAAGDAKATDAKATDAKTPADVKGAAAKPEAKAAKPEAKVDAGAPSAAPLTEAEMAALHAEHDAAQAEMERLQEGGALVPVDVTRDLVAAVVSDWTGIPIGKMVQDEASTLLELEQKIGERIKGQSYALRNIAEVVRSSKMGLGNPRAPMGVFLLVGPSGVGKTETGRVLADLLFGGERFMVAINMSEFQEKHTVSRLIGSPPGYVGYGEGGVLTEAVRQRPYSAVMLDEVEKADPEVLNLFYQVFDKGELADGEGRVIDFKNTVLLLTSNLGSELMTDMCMANPPPTKEAVIKAIRPILVKHFKAALLARMTIVPYFPLSGSAMRQIVDLKMKELINRLLETHKIEMQVEEKVSQQIVERCAEVETGARNIDHILSRTLLPLISRALLSQMSQGPLPSTMKLGLAEDGEYALSFEA
jgi:type VI secretion system protein VasG